MAQRIEKEIACDKCDRMFPARYSYVIGNNAKLAGRQYCSPKCSGAAFREWENSTIPFASIDDRVLVR